MVKSTRTTRRPSADQRDVLIDAAIAAFAAHGFEATSVQAIASAAGVSKAKVFYYFDGKEDLYAQALERGLEPLVSAVENRSSAGSADAFWASLEAGLDASVEFSHRDPHAAALVRGLYRRGEDTASLQLLLGRFRAAMGSWLRDGQGLGAVRTDVPVPILVEAIVGALVHIERWLALNTDDNRSAVDLMSRSFLAGFVRDALQQRTAAECEAEVAYAAEDAPRETDGYLDVSATVACPVTMRDGRQGVSPTFEREGFQLIAAPAQFDRPPSDVEARATYSAIEAALVARTDAAFARVFDHTVRHTERTPGQRPPIRVVHADYGRRAGTRRLRELLSVDEVARWADSRVVVANLWQSVAGVVHSTPVGFVDIRSVDDRDFIPVTVQYADRRGEIGYYRPNPAHRWFWFPFLRPQEALLFKTFEGRPGAGHWTCPHAAFTAPNSPDELGGRRTSIEFRILLAFDEKPGDAA